MKKLLIILITIPLIFGSCEKEEESNNSNNNSLITFEKTFGGIGWDNLNGWNVDRGYCVEQTSDNGYIIVGSTQNLNNGIHDIYLIKTDQNGNKQWSQTYGNVTGYEEGYSVQQTLDGGYIITGTIDGYMCLIKSDGNGNEQWSQTYGVGFSDIGNSVQQTSDGGYIITGNLRGFNSAGIYLIKTDQNGNEQWSQTFGTINDEGHSVKQTLDGGYIITGFDNSGIFLIKTDQNGNEQWSQTFGSSYHRGNSVQQTSDGGYIITGKSENTNNINFITYWDVCLIKTDQNGNEQWYQYFGNTDNEEGNSVQQTSDGGYVITGSKISNNSGNRDIYLIKTDQIGNEQWSQVFGGTGWDEGQSVQQTSDGGYIITGTKDDDICLIKTDQNGNVN